MIGNADIEPCIHAVSTPRLMPSQNLRLVRKSAQVQQDASSRVLNKEATHARHNHFKCKSADGIESQAQTLELLSRTRLVVLN
jgi:hypothetical protein